MRQSIDRKINTNQINTRKNYKIDSRNGNKQYLLKHDHKNFTKFNQQNNTSEYGSGSTCANPSPPIHFQPSSVHLNKMATDYIFMDNNSFENTDYESDSDDQMPTNLVHVFFFY